MNCEGRWIRSIFRIVGVQSQLGPIGTSATEWPIVRAQGDYDGGGFGGMKTEDGYVAVLFNTYREETH
jgi:hypothetical protein